MSTTKYVYVFVRKDIPLADQIVQVGHACLESGKMFKHPKGTHLVLLEVGDKWELFDVTYHLHSCKIKSFIFWEPDDHMGYTAIATEPITTEQKILFKQFSLWSV